jgi:hypothetical protein
MYEAKKSDFLTDATISSLQRDPKSARFQTFENATISGSAGDFIKSSMYEAKKTHPFYSPYFP